MERKRTFQHALSVLLLFAAGCQGELENPSILRIRLAGPTGSASPEPLSAAGMRRTAATDTGAFLLTVARAGGDTLYHGAYGSRPDGFLLPNGTYEIDVCSQPFSAPAFDAPQYGDRQMAILTAGQEVQVELCCKLINSSLRFTFAGSFRNRYGGGALLLRSDAGSLTYGLEEQRAAWFPPGDVAVVYRNGDTTETLFSRRLAAGTCHHLTLNASSDEAAAGFSIRVDTTATLIAEELIIGPGYPACDGLSRESAYDLATAAGHSGDTAWVWGYIVGGDLSASSIRFEPPFEKNSHLAVAASALERDRSKCFSVELNRAAVRSALNLVDHPELLGRRVVLRGLLSTYFSLPGLRSVSDFSL